MIIYYNRNSESKKINKLSHDKLDKELLKWLTQKNQDNAIQIQTKYPITLCNITETDI